MSDWQTYLKNGLEQACFEDGDGNDLQCNNTMLHQAVEDTITHFISDEAAIRAVYQQFQNGYAPNDSDPRVVIDGLGLTPPTIATSLQSKYHYSGYFNHFPNIYLDFHYMPALRKWGMGEDTFQLLDIGVGVDFSKSLGPQGAANSVLGVEFAYHTSPQAVSIDIAGGETITSEPEAGREYYLGHETANFYEAGPLAANIHGGLDIRMGRKTNAVFHWTPSLSLGTNYVTRTTREFDGYYTYNGTSSYGGDWWNHLDSAFACLVTGGLAGCDDLETQYVTSENTRLVAGPTTEKSSLGATVRLDPVNFTMHGGLGLQFYAGVGLVLNPLTAQEGLTPYLSSGMRINPQYFVR